MTNLANCVVCNLKEIANRARRVSMGLAVKRLKFTPLGVKIEKGVLGLSSFLQ